MTGYRVRELTRARGELVRALEQLQWACEREDTEAGLRCAHAALHAQDVARRLGRSARALDPQFAALLKVCA